MGHQTPSPQEPLDVRVLVVDDDEDTREAMVRLLQTFGVWARAAGDGEEALHLVPEVQPTLILCDLRMPRLDGVEFVKRLRRLPPFQETFTVAITGLRGPLAVAASREAGFDGHLEKPMSAEMLARVLHRAGLRLH
jgi:CheY-like chemotaxis protein